jgi:hypothetical protein
MKFPYSLSDIIIRDYQLGRIKRESFMLCHEFCKKIFREIVKQ